MRTSEIIEQTNKCTGAAMSRRLISREDEFFFLVRRRDTSLVLFLHEPEVTAAPSVSLKQLQAMFRNCVSGASDLDSWPSLSQEIRTNSKSVSCV